MAFWFCVCGLIFWLLAAVTTKPVAEFIAPKKEGFSAIPRMIFSTFWFAFGGLFSGFMAIIFALLTALVTKL